MNLARFRFRTVFPAVALSAAWLSLATADPAVAQTLKDVCGAQAGGQYASSPVLGAYCQSAYTNGNLWIVNDNDSRVETSVAVVCAYSCLSGGLTSCSGGGGSPCSAAENTGYTAYNLNTASSNNYIAAQQNGLAAANLAGNAAGMNAGLAGGSSVASGATGGPGSAPAISSSCQAAAASGSVGDRIACAAESDSSLPAFAQTPQFLADFQAATGTSLQSVINESGQSIIENYAPDALQHAYGAVQGKESFEDFVNQGMSLLNTIAGNFGSSSDKSKFFAQVVPSSLSGFVPQSGYPVTKVGSPPTPQAQKLAASALAQPVRDGAVGGAASDRAPAALNLGSEPEYNPKISLFDRVSLRYQKSDLFTERARLSAWEAPPPSSQTR